MMRHIVIVAIILAMTVGLFLSVSGRLASAIWFGKFYQWCQIILTTSVILLAYQIGADHNARRKETVIKVVQQLTQAGIHVRSVRKLIESLPEGQISNIVNDPDAVNSVTFDMQYARHLNECLSLGGSNATTNKYYTVVNGSQSIELTPDGTDAFRGCIVKLFNELETVFMSWKHNTSDRVMIIEQFKPFFEENRGLLVDSFRKIYGNEKSYPCTARFINFLEGSKLLDLISNYIRSWW